MTSVMNKTMYVLEKILTQIDSFYSDWDGGLKPTPFYPKM